MTSKRRKVETFENMAGGYTTSDGLVDAVGKTEKESKERFKEIKRFMRERNQ